MGLYLAIDPLSFLALLQKGITMFLIFIVLIACSLQAQDIPDKFLGETVQSAWSSIQHNINTFFIPHSISIAADSNLSVFQKLFRQTVTFTQNSTNYLTELAQATLEKSKEQMLSLEEVAQHFIHTLEKSGNDGMKLLLQQTLDVDLDALLPTISNIQTHLSALNNNIPALEKSTVQPEIYELLNYLDITHANALSLQKAGISSTASSLTAYAMSGKEDNLTKAFMHMYYAYPTIISHINALHIPQAGLIAHTIFNISSELIEQITLMHQASGKIGSILVDKALVHPLDILKNKVRKLGNSLEFVTSTQPIIVISAPSTHDMLLEILKTFLWRGGFSLKSVALDKIERIMAIKKPMELQIQKMMTHMQTLYQTSSQWKDRLQRQFIAALKESPLTNIPQAPKILLDLLENETAILKTELSNVLFDSLVLVHQISDGVALCSSLFDCINKCMGATARHPFINRDIVRGLEFISEDVLSFTNSIINVREALKEYNPIPFRSDEDILSFDYFG